MTGASTLDRLDARGRAAAAGLHAATAARPVPAFDPDPVRISLDADVRDAGDAVDADRRRLAGRPAGGGAESEGEGPTGGAGMGRAGGRGRRVGLALAVAAAVVVVAAAVALVVGVGGDDQRPVDRVGADDLRRYVLDPAPDGYALEAVSDPDDPVVGEVFPDPFGPVTVLGPSVDAPALGLVAMDGASVEANVSDGAVEIGGRRAWPADGAGSPGLIVDVDGHQVLVFPGATPVAESEGVIAAMRVADGRVVVPGDALPTGWRDLGTVPAEALVPEARGLHGGDEAQRTWSATYRRADGATTIQVVARRGTALDVHATALVSPDARTTTVVGHRAVVAPVPVPRPDDAEGAPIDDQWASVTWEARPGEVVTVAGIATTDVLLAAASDVVVADADLDGLREQAMRFGIDDGWVLQLAEGTFSDGSPWVLTADGRRDVELRTTAAASARADQVDATATPSEGLDAPVLEVVSAARTDDVGWIYGPLRQGVATVEVRISGTDDVVAEGRVVHTGDIWAWIAEVPLDHWPEPGSQALEVVSRDETGARVGDTSVGG